MCKRMEEYGGMQATPLNHNSDDQCIGLTLSKQRCKKKKMSGCNKYCHTHTDMYKYERPSECIVCTEALPSECRPTKCGHYIHPKCLSEWFKRSNQCPVCRTVLNRSTQQLQVPQQLTIQMDTQSFVSMILTMYENLRESHLQSFMHSQLELQTATESHN